MMFASFLIMAGCGGTYLFGTYSKEIKSTLDYDQTTLNILSTFKELGANVGVLSGLLAEVVPPSVVLLVGAAMNFVGYFMVWLAVMKKIPKPKVWQMSLYICIGANSQNFANTGALATVVKNFPESRGMVLGIMKGFVGLSGAIFTQVYLAIYGDDAKSLILLIGWLPAVISLMFVYTIRPMKASSHSNEIKVFYEYLYITIALAVLMMGLTIAQKEAHFAHSGYVGSVVAICVLILMPLFIAFREEYTTWVQNKKPALPTTSVVLNHDLDHDHVQSTKPKSEIEVVDDLSHSENKDADEDKKEKFCCTDICNPPKRGEDYSILQALLSMDMFLLVFATFCGLGCSLTTMDNLGQIGEALGYKQHTINTFVSLVSIWNYCGRVFAGFVSEVILLKYKIPRPLIMAMALLFSALSNVIIAYPFPGSVYIASVLVGFSFGAQLTLLFIIISELFGLKYFSTLFNCGQLASPLGTYVLSVLVVGKLYDKEALKQLADKGLTRSMVKSLTCIGEQCYRVSFLVLAFVNVFGALLTFLLVFRTRKYYSGDIYKRYKDQQADNEKKELGS